MGHRLFDFSSDVGVEGDGPSVAEALTELGRALAQVLTDDSRILRAETHPIDVSADKDLAGVAVTFLNELIYLFDTDQFLLADANLRVDAGPDGIRVRGTLLGERLDPSKHRSGRGVKAATYHDASHEEKDGRHAFRVVLDL